MDIEKALRQYQKTKAFSDDCQNRKTELFNQFHVLTDDLIIEHIVLKVKRNEVEERRNLI